MRALEALGIHINAQARPEIASERVTCNRAVATKIKKISAGDTLGRWGLRLPIDHKKKCRMALCAGLRQVEVRALEALGMGGDYPRA